MKEKNWIVMFIPVLILTVIASLVSLLSSDFYYRDSDILAIKSHYLDLINLAIMVPLGIFMLVLAFKKIYWAKLYILGILSYLAFMFGFNALSLFFNELFLVYVVLFGLSIFGIIGIYGEVSEIGVMPESSLLKNFSAGFLMLFALSVYANWLLEVISSITTGKIPENIAGMNLPVSVVHVFDMAFVLPLIFIGAILLFRRRMSGLIISTIMSAFVFHICISLLGMELALSFHNLPVDSGKLYSMYVLCPLSVIPMISLFRSVSKKC